MVLKSFIKRFKPYLRWVILALTLGFLAHTLRQNWQQVLTLRLTASGLACLVVATGVTLLAHIWSGWVWYWVLRSLSAPVAGVGAVTVYLKTNLAKYLPGNVWHFWGRIQALREASIPAGTAVLGVVLEPLLMAAAALAVIVFSQTAILLQGLILVGVLVGIHPRILNLVLDRLTRAKLKQSELAVQPERLRLTRYPLKPLLGEVGFVLGRGAGFLLAFSALEPVPFTDIGTLIGNFSLAWLLGLVVPGAPGGIGIFEATALALLTPKFSAAIVLGAVALYRLISTIAEALGAGLAVIDDTWNDTAGYSHGLSAAAPFKASPTDCRQ